MGSDAIDTWGIEAGANAFAIGLCRKNTIAAEAAPNATCMGTELNSVPGWYSRSAAEAAPASNGIRRD
jgi:hypothetical protein